MERLWLKLKKDHYMKIFLFADLRIIIQVVKWEHGILLEILLKKPKSRNYDATCSFFFKAGVG
jgi:hypothetical protein